MALEKLKWGEVIGGQCCAETSLGRYIVSVDGTLRRPFGLNVDCYRMSAAKDLAQDDFDTHKIAFDRGARLAVEALKIDRSALDAGLGEDPRLDLVKNALTEALQEAYFCGRTWQAWAFGTMSEDDFQLISEIPEALDQIARAVVSAVDGVSQ